MAQEDTHMKSIRPLSRQIAYLFGTVGILISLISSAFPVFAFASPTTMTSRSIQMSSSTADKAGVTYKLTATTSTTISTSGAVYVEFCDSASGPLIGQACTHPPGFDVSSVAMGSGSSPAGTVTNSTGLIKWSPTASFSAGTLSLIFTGIHNPTDVATFYARVTTYASTPDYTAADSVGTVADEGGIALSTTNDIGITAYVRESLSFCVANVAPEMGCQNLTAGDNPSMTLGELIDGGPQRALDPSVVSTGTDYAQLSTNASSGAVVNMHSSTTGCGGLVRIGAPSSCDITPQTNTAGTFLAGNAKFGVETGPVAAATSGTGTTSGTLVATNNYSSGNYFLDYVAGDASGVTGPYGSAFFTSNGLPVSNQNMPFTFGVSAANDTPAGIYSATLNLIATGTF